MGTYETDLTNEQWRRIASLIPASKPGGRPRSTDMRRVVEAVLYLVKTGCQWRNLPSDFPPWRTVYGYFEQWSESGVIRRMHRVLYFETRRHEGRRRYPSAIIIDSQSVKTSKMGGERGYDGGKHVKGRKRHLVVDTLGLPMAVTVTAANVHDLRGGKQVLQRVSTFIGGRSVKKLYADGGYQGEPFRQFVDGAFDATVRISKNLAQKLKKFMPVSQRWVVERTFAWIYDYRRLVIDYERKTSTSRDMLRFAAIRLMLNRLVSPPLSQRL